MQLIFPMVQRVGLWIMFHRSAWLVRNLFIWASENITAGWLLASACNKILLEGEDGISTTRPPVVGCVLRGVLMFLVLILPEFSL